MITRLPVLWILADEEKLPGDFLKLDEDFIGGLGLEERQRPLKGRLFFDLIEEKFLLTWFLKEADYRF